jgi:hypothetical protein
LLQQPTEVSETKARLNWQENTVYERYIIDIRRSDSAIAGLNGNLFRGLDIGYTGTYLVDLLLDPDTAYLYRLTGVTALGDRRTTAWSEFSTLTQSSTLVLNGDRLSWPLGEINKLEASLSSDFRFCLEGWSPKTVDDYNQYPLASLLDRYQSVYIRGYLDTLTRQSSVTNTIDTSKVEFVRGIVVTNSTIKVELNPTDTKHKLSILKRDGQNLIPVSTYTYPVILDNDWVYSFNGLESGTTYIIESYYLDNTTNIYTNVVTNTVTTYTTSDVFKDYTENVAVAAPVVSQTYIGDDLIVIDTTSLLPVAVKATVWQGLDLYTYYYEGTKTNHLITCTPDTTTYISVVAIDGTDISEPVDLTIASLASTAETVSPLTNIAEISGVSILNTQQAIVTWSTVLEATNYNVEVSLTNDFSVLENGLSTSRLSSTSILLSGINSTLVYYIRVQAYNRRYLGDYGTPATVDTTP